jgi:hypothetical protein
VRRVAAFLALAALIAVPIAAFGNEPGDPIVTVPPGLELRLTPEQAVTAARAQPRRVLSVRAYADESQIPHWGDTPGSRPVWVVRMVGRFTPDRGLRIGHRSVFPTAFSVVDDRSAEAVGFGMP